MWPSDKNFGSKRRTCLSAELLDSLPKHFVGLPVIGIQFMSEIFTGFNFGQFHLDGCCLSRFSVSWIQRNFGSALKPCLVGYFSCLNNSFSLLVPQRVTYLPLYVTPSRFRPHVRAADKATAALNSRHSTSAFDKHFGSSRNKDDTLSIRCPKRSFWHLYHPHFYLI